MAPNAYHDQGIWKPQGETKHPLAPFDALNSSSSLPVDSAFYFIRIKNKSVLAALQKDGDYTTHYLDGSILTVILAN